MMNAGFTSIKEIASFSGFSDPLYFSKVFKKHYGMSPGEYMEKEIKKNTRKRLKKGDDISEYNIVFI